MRARPLLGIYYVYIIIIPKSIAESLIYLRSESINISLSTAATFSFVLYFSVEVCVSNEKFGNSDFPLRLYICWASYILMGSKCFFALSLWCLYSVCLWTFWRPDMKPHSGCIWSIATRYLIFIECAIRERERHKKLTRKREKHRKRDIKAPLPAILSHVAGDSYCAQLFSATPSTKVNCLV